MSRGSQVARADGLNDGALAEVVANVALNLFTNYFNHVAESDIDFPKVEPIVDHYEVCAAITGCDETWYANELWEFEEDGLMRRRSELPSAHPQTVLTGASRSGHRATARQNRRTSVV